MAEKKWSDYWGRYKSSSSNYSPKPQKEFKTKPEKNERQKIVISPPKMSSVSKPDAKFNLNITAAIIVVLVLGLLGLGIWSSKSANTVKVLFGERTELECKLGNCTEQLESVNASLLVCNSNVDTCNKDLSSKISSLNSCETSKGNLNQDYLTCKDDLLQYKRDISNVQDDYDDCKSSLSSKNSQLNDCNDNYDDLKNNYKNLCDSHCSQACAFDSGSDRYSCPQTTTTTITTTTTTTTTV